MNLIKLSIQRPVFAWVIMFALIVFGAICANRLGISQMPDVNFPIVNVSFTYDGAAPEIIETELIDPIETRLLSIEGIKEMKSTARQGGGSVRLEFDIDRNVDVVLQEVQTAIGRLRLPTGVEPPTIRKENPEEDPILIISVFGEDDFKKVLGWTDQFLLDQLRFLPGVGEVSIGGFSEPNVRIWLDKFKLEQNQLTIDDVVQALNSEHLESAAGQFSSDKRELRVRWLGEAGTIEDIKNITILRRGGQRIFDREFKIKDVATVEDGLSDIRRLARVNGVQAVAMQIRKQRGTNEIEVAKGVLAKLESLKDRFPKGYDYRINVDYTLNTESTFNLTIEKLIVAALITIVICFLFLGSFSAAVNILFSIPTSIVGTGIVLYFSGFTLNLFTLLALTLAISIVVDDAIMLLENIVRHYRMGKTPSKAAYDGAIEVLPAAIAATLAVVAVFLPVVFMDGIIGKFFFQFGVTMSAAVLLSLLEAVTITPMRSAAFMRSQPKIGRFELMLEHAFEWLAKIYAVILKWTLKLRYLVVIGSLALFVGSLYLVKKVRQEFVPAQDQNIIIIQGQTAPGSSLEFTNQASKQLEEFLAKEDVIEGYFLSIGAGGPNAQVNAVFSPVTLKPKESRKESHIQIMQRWREEFKKFKGIRLTMRDISSRNLTSGRTNPIALNLLGPSLETLNEKSKALVEYLDTNKLGVDLDTDYRTGIPELLITPKRDAMAASGVSAEVVGRVLAAGVGGLRQGRYTNDGRRYDIRFKIMEDQIRTAADLERMFVRNLAGNLVRLSEIVKIEERPAVQAISRINRQRAIAVFGNLPPGQSQSDTIAKIDTFLKKELPPGYSYSLEGASAGFIDSFKSLTGALTIGILVAFLILAIQFNSFIHPISVLMALPFSISGALLFLAWFDVSLNLFSFIGLVVLMGIAKKNSILLVEFTNQVRDKNPSLSVFDALIQGCPVRLRPVLMTSVATVAAALPLVLGNSLGSETRLPMGLTIIGGTIVSTILTLFVVPAIYQILSGLERRTVVEEL